MQIRLILGDQLHEDISSLAGINPAEDIILMCEVHDEATYVKHHKKKIVFLFSAMRHFAEQLRVKGYKVQYTRLDDPENSHSFRGEVERAIQTHKPKGVVVTEPGEYRVLKDMLGWEEAMDVPVRICPDDRFLCNHAQFEAWAEGRKQLRMEYFYREMRRTHNVLMQGDKPEGGQWNYDSENRKPPKEGLEIPPTYHAKPDAITQEVMTLVADTFADHFGDIEPFHYAVTREQALHALDQFITQRLSQFGDYQDAMVQGEPWMYHSHLGFYLNCGLLLPIECVRAAEAAYYAGGAPLNAVEGFIRQILGWREYIRGIYWLKMPGYAHENFLDAQRAFPPLYWGAPTKMNCLKQCVDETKRNAYAHHIQRLMVLGNFALLAGLHPDEVNAWYLIVYADAYEWVEMPNVSGMVLFADGGLLGSKPYAASGAYINKMSDYCASCSYKVSKKNGPDACPFNYLYWDFLLRNHEVLEKNPRMGMVYKTLARMSEEKLEAVRGDAKRFFTALETGEHV